MLRMEHRREYYVPKGAIKYVEPKSGAVVYAYAGNDNGKIYLVGFHGRAQKPDFKYYFGDNEKGRAARERIAAEHFAKWRKRAEYREEVKAKPHGLQVGDIMKSVWGYEQSNVDFYEVVRLLGKSMVEIREIADEEAGGQIDMAGYKVPVPGDYVGAPMKKRADDFGVKIASYAWARKIEPKVVAGAKVFEPVFYSYWH